jgi:hypothetical protein
MTDPEATNTETDGSPADNPDEVEIDVSENKWNATASYDIYGARTEAEATAAAARAFRDEYGHKPSNKVAEQKGIDPLRWNVIVADHSSGSLKSGRTEVVTADPEAPTPDEDGDAGHGDSDAPEGWSKLEEDDRNSGDGWFKGGYEHQTEDIEIQVWCAGTAEWGYVFPDEPNQDQTEAPRFDVLMERTAYRGERDLIRDERGFKDDPEGAREKAREWAEEYAAEEEAEA